MADILSRPERSKRMRAVRQQGTAREMIVRRAVLRLGVRYAMNSRTLPGTPDLVFLRLRKVIFVHGCFWHGHDCNRGARAPKANAEYWRSKIARNSARDA